MKLKRSIVVVIVAVLSGCSSERQTAQVTLTELNRCWNADVEVSKLIGGEYVGISPEKTIVGLSEEITCSEKPRQVMILLGARRGEKDICTSVVSRHLPPTGYSSSSSAKKNEIMTIITPCPNTGTRS